MFENDKSVCSIAIVKWVTNDDMYSDKIPNTAIGPYRQYTENKTNKIIFPSAKTALTQLQIITFSTVTTDVHLRGVDRNLISAEFTCTMLYVDETSKWAWG